MAASNATTQAKLERKWIPAPAFSAERRGHYLAPSDARHILSQDALLKATRTLTQASAIDALGWSHEAWQTAYRGPKGQQLLRELLVLYATGEVGKEATDLINCCLAIPLYKDTAGEGLRPIAIPSVFRKVYARVFVSKFRPQLREAAGPHQFGAMSPDGARGIACALRDRCTSIAQLYMRTDITNAFNQADRQATLASLARAHPLLEAGQFAWLRHPTQAVLTAPSGGRRVMTTDVGIPQGDPLSSLAFSLQLAEPLAELNTPDHAAVAYADDTVLIAGPEHMHTALHRWEELLRPLGLTLNRDKCELWNPGELPLPPALTSAYPHVRVSHRGFRVCGLPLDKVDVTDPLPDTPWGDDTYTQAFLQEAREALQQRMRVLAAFVIHHGPQTEALHVALHILRTNLSGRLVHLYRFCPWTLLRPWTATLTEDLHAWLRIIVGLPFQGPHPLLALHSPLAQGGLGIPHPQQEAALHHLQAMWPLIDELSPAEQERSPACLGALEALEFLNRLADHDLRAASAATSASHRGANIRTIFYERMGLQLRTVCPWLQSPALPNVPDAHITWRWQMKIQMSWFTAGPRAFLLAGPLRLAMAQHLGLRLYAPGQRCRYIPLTTGRMCGKQLGTHSAHACTCAQGPSLRRHNRLRDEWIRLCRQAGWHTDPEQSHSHTRR